MRATLAQYYTDLEISECKTFSRTQNVHEISLKCELPKSNGASVGIRQNLLSLETLLSQSETILLCWSGKPPQNTSPQIRSHIYNICIYI